MNVMIPNDLRKSMMRVSQLTPYMGNAKKHPDWQVEQIANSIQAFGFNDPIAIWDDIAGHHVIVEGHGRLLAAKQLGMEEVPVIRLDQLDDEARRAYTLAHNKLTMNTDFDIQLLDSELDAIEGFDMAEFGFEGFDGMQPEAEAEEVPVPDDAEQRVSAGEVWQLGRHRLMCGDSTDREAVSKLMDGNRADACFTSPPYNLGVQKFGGNLPNRAMGAGNPYAAYDDNLTDSDYQKLLTDSLGNALEFADDALFNIGILAGSKQGIIGMLSAYSDRFCDVLVWSKEKAMPMGLESQSGLVAHECELVFCFNQTGTRSFTHPQWERGKGSNRIETENNTGNEYGKQHHAAFPVSFASKVVSDFTSGSVLDLFGGTGTTLIAAEQLGRTCYMMELDPHYCDIILARWESMTGLTAERVA